MSKSKGFIAEFRTFISRGNVMDMAVGVIIGGAFTAIVTSLTTDIINPLITLVSGGNGADMGALNIKVTDTVSMNFGSFIGAVISSPAPKRRLPCPRPPAPTASKRSKKAPCVAPTAAANSRRPPRPAAPRKPSNGAPTHHWLVCEPAPCGLACVRGGARDGTRPVGVAHPHHAFFAFCRSCLRPCARPL